jgi:phage tail sheath protein FI
MPTYLSPGVYMEEVSAGAKPIEAVGTATAAFVGFTEKGPVNEPILVTSWPQYTREFGEFVEGAYLPLAMFNYFLNGGGNAYVVRVGADGDGQDGARAGANGGRKAAERGSAPAELTRQAVAELPGAEGKPSLTVRSQGSAEEAAGLSVRVGPASEGGEETFKLEVVRGDEVVETYDNVGIKRGSGNVATAVKQSKLITIEEFKGGTLDLPQHGQVQLTPAAEPPLPEIAVSPDMYVGDVSDRTGFGALEALEDVTMLVVPDLMSAYERGALDDEQLKGVQLAMIAHCELMGDRVAILDAPPGLNAQKLREWRMDTAGYDSKYATLYWPWLKVLDPATGKPTMMPPSGSMAGIWARSDDTRGVHKAPANEIVRGAIALELNITKGEHDTLNPVGVNCIRAFPGQGIRVWGARTLSSDPEWRYLNVRRLFNFVEKSILLGTNWVVFEPNDPALWDRVRRTITMFLRRVWQTGALFGMTPGEAFWVKCDAENNTRADLDLGILTVEIGIAPVKPAEFVVFKLQQMSDGAALEE